MSAASLSPSGYADTFARDHLPPAEQWPTLEFTTDWLLYAQEAISVEDGRGTAVGRFFTTDGTLVATVVQEGMLRAGGSR